MRASQTPTQSSYYSQSQGRGGSKGAKRGKFTPKARIQRYPTMAKMGAQAFPKQLSSTLTYAEQVGIQFLGTGIGFYVFSCNGLYDPNITGTGHQPLYFDQMMSIYNHYHVISSSITIQCAASTSSAPTTTDPRIHTQMLYIDDDTTAASTLSSVLERPGVKWNTVNTDGGLTPKLSSGWNAVKTFGAGARENTELTGTVAANPVEQSFWNIIVDGGTPRLTDYVNYNVVIKYNVIFDELKTIAQS